MPLSTTSMASRDTRSRSLPVESTCASSVIAGTCRSSRSASNRRSSHRARRPGQLGGPAELAFDLLDELADLGGRRLGLLVLNPDQGRLVLAIIEEDLENAVGQQRDADHRDEQRNVFGEQPAADSRPGGPATARRIRRGRRRERSAFRRIGMEGNASSRPNLARTRDVVSCRSAAGLFDDLVGQREQGRRHVQTDALAVFRLSTNR